MTSCIKAMKLMQSLIDGELASPRKERVLTHLAQCVDCGLKYETYQAIKSSVSRLGAPTVDEAAVQDLTSFARDLIQQEPRS